MPPEFNSLQVLAFIAFRQPISQAEIDQLFDADKRGLDADANLKLKTSACTKENALPARKDDFFSIL